MKRKLSIIYVVFRDVIMLITFVLALKLEGAGRSEFMTMVVLFFCPFSVVHIREGSKRVCSTITLFFCCGYILLVMLDETSKISCKLLFSMCILLCSHCSGIYAQRKSRFVVSFAVVAAAFFKYLKFVQALFWERYKEHFLCSLLHFLYFYGFCNNSGIFQLFKNAFGGKSKA